MFISASQKRCDASRSRNSIDAVVRRIHGTEIGKFDLLKLVTIHPKLKAFQVLSPVEVGINQDPAAIFWAPRQFVKERQIIGVGLETRYKTPHSSNKHPTS